MSPLDFLYYSLSLGFIVLVIFLSIAAYRLAQTLKTFKTLLDRTEDITRDVQMMKDQLKGGLATGMGTILTILTSLIRKRR
jgi:hypothetical protein